MQPIGHCTLKWLLLGCKQLQPDNRSQGPTDTDIVWPQADDTVIPEGFGFCSLIRWMRRCCLILFISHCINGQQEHTHSTHEEQHWKVTLREGAQDLRIHSAQQCHKSYEEHGRDHQPGTLLNRACTGEPGCGCQYSGNQPSEQPHFQPNHRSHPPIRRRTPRGALFIQSLKRFQTNAYSL